MSYTRLFKGVGDDHEPGSRAVVLQGQHHKQTRPRLIIKTKPRRYCYRCVGAARASTSCLHRPRPIRAHDVTARSWPRGLSSRPPAAPGTPLGLLEVLIPQPEHVGAALPRGRPEQKAAQRIPVHGVERVSRASGRAHHGEPVHPSRASRSSQAAGTGLANAVRQRRGGVSHNIVWL